MKEKLFLNEESGQGTFEYAVIITAVAVLVIAALTIIGEKVVYWFNEVLSYL